MNGRARNSSGPPTPKPVSDGAVNTHDESIGAAQWPAHESETVPWSQATRGGAREDRMLREIEASIPPFIADLEYSPAPALFAAATDAQSVITRLDAGVGPEMQPLAQLLTRTEAVSSSKIEGIQASFDDYARAAAGVKANANATSMVAAGLALTQLIEHTGTRGELRLADVLDAHRVLMRDDPTDGRYAGQLRTVQNWIGGSDFSPRGAVHVPPIPGRVEELMNDLVRFANRDDLPALPQAAIVHAQFESIHPFTDGNGRIGRALINAVLRRRNVTQNLVLPVATAMVANRKRYFDLVNAYRTGAVDPFVSLLITAARIAAEESAVTGRHLSALPAKWATLTKPRSGSAAAAILQALPTHPVMSATLAEQIAGGPTSSVYSALDRLEADGIIHEVTGRTRNRAYVASAIMDELADLETRIERRI